MMFICTEFKCNVKRNSKFCICIALWCRQIMLYDINEFLQPIKCFITRIKLFLKCEGLMFSLHKDIKVTDDYKLAIELLQYY